MEGFFIIFLLVGAAIAIPLAIHGNKRANEAWANAGRQLKLRSTPAKLGQKRQLEGRYQGMRVRVDTFTRSSGKSSTTYTRFKASFPENLGLGLNLTSEGFFSGIGKAFGSQDIETGDSSFDDAVLVKGANPVRVIEFLTTARRIRIHRFLRSHKGAVITDQGILWSRRGLLRDSSSLVSRTKRIAEVARCLFEDREQDANMERVLEAQHGGHVEEALGLLTVPIPAFLPAAEEDASAQVEELPSNAVEVEEQVLKGELLYLGGRLDEAKEAFTGALEQDPEDEEARSWIDRVSAKPAPPSPPAGPEALDLQAVCAELFPAGASSFEVGRLFEESFQGKRVRGSGVLKAATKFTYDFVFDSKSGTKATLEIGETDTGAYGRKEVLAVLELPVEAADELASRLGETLVFEGVLKKADGFMHNLFVAEAVEIGDSASGQSAAPNA